MKLKCVENVSGKSIPDKLYSGIGDVDEKRAGEIVSEITDDGDAIYVRSCRTLFIPKTMLMGTT